MLYRFLLASIITGLLGLTSETANAQVAEVATVGGLIDQLSRLAKTLEDSGHSLMEHGNAIAAQEQLLLAGVLQGTITKMREAYKSSMNQTFDRLDISQANAFGELRSAMRDAWRLEGRTSADLGGLVYKTQSAAQQLLDVIPLTDKSPIYFGTQTRDILASFDPSPTDLVVLGYHFTDKRLNNRKPDIYVTAQGTGRVRLPDDHVEAQFDRLNIELTDELRTLKWPPLSRPFFALNKLRSDRVESRVSGDRVCSRP